MTMSLTTIFLLILIISLGANAFLWFIDKSDKNKKTSFESSSTKSLKTIDFLNQLNSSNSFNKIGLRKHNRVKILENYFKKI